MMLKFSMRGLKGTILVFAIICIGITFLFTVIRDGCVYFHGVEPFNENAGTKLGSKNEPLIFVGGYGSSGTTITRFLLDAHPDIRCGGESMVNTILLSAFKRNYIGKYHLETVGVTQEVLDTAMREFIFSIIKNTGRPAHRLCDKRSGQFDFMNYLAKLFPEAQFVLIFRDVRGSVSSNLRRNIIPMNMTYPEAFDDWEETNKLYLQYCEEIGSQKCYKLLYERLILYSEFELRQLLAFLKVTWDPIVLKHHEIVTNITHYKAKDLSNVASRKQLHDKSLYKWMKDPEMKIDLVVNKSMQSELMKAFGYSRLGYPPDYRKLMPIR